MLENSLYSMTNIEIVLLVGPDTVRILQKCRVSLLITDDWVRKESSGSIMSELTKAFAVRRIGRTQVP